MRNIMITILILLFYENLKVAFIKNCAVDAYGNQSALLI